MHVVARRCLPLVLCVLTVAASRIRAAEPTLTVVGPGLSTAVVIPGEPPPGAETFKAAAELVRCLETMTGTAPAFIAEGRGVHEWDGRRWRLKPFAPGAQRPQDAVELHVGWTALCLKTLDRAKVEELDIDGHQIKVTDGAVFLVGPKDWSTAYACFTFLEEFCGVRWFLPGAFGEVVPRQSTLAVTVGERTFEPAYQHRQYSGFQWRDDGECQRWGMHRKIRARLNYHHNLYNVFDVGKYGEKYPDLYPVIGGKRRIPGPGNKGGWQPCLTHPQAVNIAMDYAREFFDRTPDASSISLGITDGGGYCECPRCLKLEDESLPHEAQRSVWFFRFANAVAERFDGLYPDKQIGYLLYGKCKAFPPGMRVHSRLVGFYVYPSFRLITPEGMNAFNEGVQDLTEHVTRFGLYDWFYGDSVCVPRLQIRQAKYWLQYGYTKGARHCKAEAYMNWGLDGFKYWIHSRLMWDPSLDVDAMLDEFFGLFFAASAEPMRAYFKVVERYTLAPVMLPVKTAEGEEMRPVNFRFRWPEQLLSFPPAAVRECEPHLARAEELAQSDLVRERVRYFRSAFTVAQRMTLRYHAATEATALMQTPETFSRGVAALARGMDRELDIEPLYEGPLKGDDFCVRFPPDSMFGGMTRARGEAASVLSRMVVASLRTLSGEGCSQEHVDATATRVLAQALSGITDEAALGAARVAVAPYVRKIALCERASAPHVDGLLDDFCWRSARQYSDLVQLGTGTPTEYETQFRATHDGARLYLAIRCYQDTRELLAWTRERDGRVWREDGVEVLLNLPEDTEPEQRFQVITNTKGNIFDYYNGSADWDGPIEVGTAIALGFYTVEMAIPLKRIGMDPEQKRFIRMNLARNVYGRKELKTGKAKELSAWYLTPFGNLDPRARGWLVFNP